MKRHYNYFLTPEEQLIFQGLQSSCITSNDPAKLKQVDLHMTSAMFKNLTPGNWVKNIIDFCLL